MLLLIDRKGGLCSCTLVKYFEVRYSVQNLVDAVGGKSRKLAMNLAEIKEKFHERADERPIFILVLGSKLLD